MFTRLRLLPVHNANEAIHTMVNIAKVSFKKYQLNVFPQQWMKELLTIIPASMIIKWANIGPQAKGQYGICLDSQ